MAKQINIDWDTQKMVKGKCTGVGCPIRDKCERFTAKEFDVEYGYIRPPHAYNEIADNEHVPQKTFPAKCLNFLTNAPHKPVMQRFEIQD